jgi:hypothetical protein
MDHLTESRLVDFARGLLVGNERRGIERHISDCQECREAVALFRRVQESAREVVVPRELVEAAKALYVKTGVQWAPMLKRVVAKLVIPVSGGLQMSEVRSVQPGVPHLMYRWNDYCLDLRMDKEPESASVSLLGQIANERTPDVPVGGVPVTLTAGERVIAETRCNSLGEFCIEFMPLRGMRVRFDVEEAKVSIEVPLNKLRIEKL